MNVRELIDFLSEQDPDAEVELALVAPVDPENPDDVSVDRYPVLGMLPWRDDDSGEDETVIWLIGGESEDFDDLLAALDEQYGTGDWDEHPH
ncbi:MAG: hypothetical protein ACO3AV_06350 [Ilumatobacteraceae bacterium]|jgi:hypothetical protein